MNLRKHAVQWLDRAVIRYAALQMPPPRGLNPHLAEAAALIVSPEMFPANVPAASLPPLPRPNLGGTIPFNFASSVSTPFPRNNTVRGVFHLTPGDWSARPAVILLHGWNDPFSYNFHLPRLSRLLTHSGINSARLTLPYHFERRPERPATVRNFISEDLLRTAEATQQAVADIRALAAWLRDQGCPQVGIWGVSLGGWLSGLAMCADRGIDFGVLLTPAARMGQLMRELEFARPLRDALRGSDIDLTPLNLASHHPAQNRDRILLIKSEYDRFIAPDSIEELWEQWGRPEIWRLPHGHISVFSSPVAMRQSVEWMLGRLKATS